MITTEDLKVSVLNNLDRCDRCDAKAYVQVSGKSGSLLFCAHHYNSIIDNAVGYNAIMKFAIEIIDERHLLNDK